MLKGVGKFFMSYVSQKSDKFSSQYNLVSFTGKILINGIDLGK